jgi:hypothetical protein
MPRIIVWSAELLDTCLLGPVFDRLRRIVVGNTLAALAITFVSILFASSICTDERTAILYCSLPFVVLSSLRLDEVCSGLLMDGPTH